MCFRNSSRRWFVMRELLEVFHNANQHLLAALYDSHPAEQHRDITLRYAGLMQQLVEYSSTEFFAAGQLTTAFIRGLHRLLFPPDYPPASVLVDGAHVETIPGEYKSYQQGTPGTIQPHGIKLFMPPEQVPEAMELIVATVERQLKTAPDVAGKRDAIMVFTLDYLEIHPFFDGNGRMACMLVDLLLLREGLPTLNLSGLYRHNLQTKNRLILLIEEARTTRQLDAFYAFISSQPLETR